MNPERAKTLLCDAISLMEEDFLDKPVILELLGMSEMEYNELVLLKATQEAQKEEE